MIFLDANASVPALEIALEAFARVARMRGNASSPHAIGRGLRARLDLAREQVATAIEADPEGLVFTSGASEANRWLVDAIPRGARVWSSALEHPSLAKPLAVLAAAGEIELTHQVPEAEVVITTAAHNETGLLIDLDEVVAQMRPEALLFVDAAQAVGRVPFAAGRADAVTFSAHKLGGLPGAGALWLSARGLALDSPWTGGGQEGGRRPGTEPVALLAAFGAACAVVDETRAAHRALAADRDRLEAALLEAWRPAQRVGDGPRLPNTSAIAIEGVDGDALRMSIDRAGVCVGFGAACSALAPEASPGLISLGLDEALARATVRLSLAPGAADIDAAIAALAGALPRRR